MGGTYFCYLPFVLSQLYSWRLALSRVLHLCVFHKGEGKIRGNFNGALAALECLARLVFGRRKHIALSLHRRHETERFMF